MRAPPLTPLAAALLQVPAPERALLVNCGDGEAALLIAREFPSARVRGVDPSAESVRAASARVGLDPEGRIAFKAGKTRHLPFPDGHFDLVAQVAGRTSPAEIRRVLRPGGHFVLVRPGAGGPLERLAEWALPKRLARRGIVPLGGEQRGPGKFLVARVEKPGEPATAV